MAKIAIPDNLTGKALFRFLKENKGILIAEKKLAVKYADAIALGPRLYVDKSGALVKAAPNTTPIEDGDTESSITRACVINTCNWLDSHSDVHIPGLWKRSLAVAKDRYLLQEHKMSFQGIITGDVEAYTQSISWKALGVDIGGSTEALIYKATISNNRNPYMFDQYKAGYVKNHSVGMMYVDIQLAVNEPDEEYYKDEFAVWSKYIGQIANRDDAEAQGYFFAVREAKEIEGSAVVLGSNSITPVLESSTGKHSPDGTADRSQEMEFNLDAAIKTTKFFN